MDAKDYVRHWTFVKKRLARIGALLVAGSMVATFFSIPVSDKVLVGIFTVILLGLYELAIDTHSKITEFYRGSAVRLYSLYLCRTELEELFARCPRNAHVSIDHLGLDMSQAWEYIHTLLFDNDSKAVNVEYRLLILTDNENAKANWPKEVVHWSEYVPKSLVRIREDMEEAVQMFARERRSLRFSVRKYDDVPVMHGWSIRQPVKLWHVGHCRWRKKTFDWGGEKYVRVDAHSPDPVAQEIANLFDSYFEHLWEVSSPVDTLQFHVGREVERGKRSSRVRIGGLRRSARPGRADRGGLLPTAASPDPGGGRANEQAPGSSAKRGQ